MNSYQKQTAETTEVKVTLTLSQLNGTIALVLRRVMEMDDQLDDDERASDLVYQSYRRLLRTLEKQVPVESA
jgi:hypothetical protein